MPKSACACSANQDLSAYGRCSVIARRGRPDYGQLSVGEAAIPTPYRGGRNPLTGVAMVVALIGVLALAGCAATHPAGGPTSAKPKPVATSTYLPPSAPQPGATPLSVSAYPNAAALVPAFTAEQSDWNNAGATPANAAKSNADSSGKVRSDIIARADASYVKALMVSNFDSTSDVGTYVSAQEGVHSQTVGLNFLNVEFKQKVPYVRDVAVVPGSVVPIVESATVITAKFEVVESDNADPANNNVLQYTKGATLSATPEPVQLTWTNVGGYWKLSGVVHSG